MNPNSALSNSSPVHHGTEEERERRINTTDEREARRLKPRNKTDAASEVQKQGSHVHTVSSCKEIDAGEEKPLGKVAETKNENRVVNEEAKKHQLDERLDHFEGKKFQQDFIESNHPTEEKNRKSISELEAIALQKSRQTTREFEVTALPNQRVNATHRLEKNLEAPALSCGVEEIRRKSINPSADSMRTLEDSRRRIRPRSASLSHFEAIALRKNGNPSSRSRRALRDSIQRTHSLGRRSCKSLNECEDIALRKSRNTPSGSVPTISEDSRRTTPARAASLNNFEAIALRKSGNLSDFVPTISEDSSRTTPACAASLNNFEAVALQKGRNRSDSISTISQDSRRRGPARAASLDDFEASVLRKSRNLSDYEEYNESLGGLSVGAFRVRGNAWNGIEDDDDETYLPPSQNTSQAAEVDMSIQSQPTTLRDTTERNSSPITGLEMPVEMPTQTQPKTKKEKWILMSIILLLIVVAVVAIGLIVGHSNSEKEEDMDIVRNIVPTIGCNQTYGDMLLAPNWKSCLCGEGFQDNLAEYVNRYDALGLTSNLNVSSCDCPTVALLWLTQSMVESGIEYNDTSLVSRFVLANFFLSWYDYNAPWKTMDGWMTYEDECQWYGVVCNEDAEVISISLRRNRLSGLLPTELGLLSHLSKLELDDNHISGTIPTEVGRLENLVRLRIKNNKISGGVPTEFGQLTKIEQIQLSTNKIKGNIPKELGQLKSLKHLYLHLNQLTGTIPSELGKLMHLEDINLSNNVALKGIIPTALGQCRSLQSISLDVCQLSGIIPSEVGQLSNLQWFSASFNKLHGSIPFTFEGFNQLHTLSLASNELTGTIPPTLGLNSTLLERLQLSSNSISGTIPKEIGMLSNLQLMDFRDNNLHGSIPSQLGLCLSLTLISFDYNRQVLGTIPSELGALTKLTTFRVAGTKLEGKVPDEICSLPKINTIWADCREKISCDCCNTCL